MTNNSRAKAGRQTRAESRGDAPGSGSKQTLRTCVGCRSRYSKERLLRYVADGRGHLALDPQHLAPGRGVYVCPSPHCIRAACRRGGFARGLRRRVAQPDPDELVRRAVDRIRDRAERLIEAALLDGRADSGASELDLEHDRCLELGRIVRVVSDGRLRWVLATLAEQLSRLRSEMVSDELGT